MTDEASTWRAASLSVPPNTPVGCYVGDAETVLISHDAPGNVWLRVRRPDTHAEAEEERLRFFVGDHDLTAHTRVVPLSGATEPDELPVDRCIRLMGELEEVWEEVPHAPGSIVELFSLGTRLKNERKWLEGIVAAVRGPQASDQEEADQEEWVECEWYTRYVDGVCGLVQVCAGEGCGRAPFRAEDVCAWDRRKPRGLPRWAYDQLEPRADSC